MKPFQLAILFSAVLFAAAAAQAQEKKAGPPAPGPEVKKLAYFAGNWTSEGEVKPNPMMPAGKMTSTDVCTWYKGGFFVVCNSKGSGPMGSVQSTGVLGYDTEGKAYTYYGYDSIGHGSGGKGTTDGKTWTYTSEEKAGGKTMYGRYVIADMTPDSYTFKWDMSEDNKTWTNVMEGKSTRAKAAEKK